MGHKIATFIPLVGLHDSHCIIRLLTFVLLTCSFCFFSSSIRISVCIKWVRTLIGLNSTLPLWLPHPSRVHPHGKLKRST